MACAGPSMWFVTVQKDTQAASYAHSDGRCPQASDADGCASAPSSGAPASSQEGEETARGAAPPSPLTSQVHHTLDQELTSYLEAPVVGIESDPKAWWASEAAHFPLLRVGAAYFQSIAATSFSTAQVCQFVGPAIPRLRSTMSAKTVGEFLLLRQNLPCHSKIGGLMEAWGSLDRGPDSEDEADFIPDLADPL